VRTKSFHEKLTYHLGCVKKIKFVAKNKAFCEICFVFFTSTIKIFIFTKLYESIQIVEMCMHYFLLNLVDNYKYDFWMEGAYTLGAKLNFRSV
jgi:hypothetical protein